MYLYHQSIMHIVVIGISLTVLLLSIVTYIYNINSTVDDMANNGLLFTSNVAKVHSVCAKASKYVRKLLYININKSENILPMLSKQIDNLYLKATAQCGNLDVRLMLKPSYMKTNIKTTHPINMILYDNELSQDAHKLKQAVLTVSNECKLKSIDIADCPEEVTTDDPVKTYEYVALGGTFDRLHNGHKILLSHAVLRATKHVTVGVTDVNMIQSKKLYELIEPLEHRIKAVLNFLTDINPDLEYNVFALQDLYGPTKDDPKFQLLVVSEETIRGATKINEKRKENGLPPLATHVIALAQDVHSQRSQEEEDKVSSSNLRMRLLGTLLRPPVPNPDIPDWPYVIGLSGGIASGKSGIAQKLKEKGATIVNCDTIAHDLYKPGLPLNSTLAETFGKEYINDMGEVDRRKLGQLVFSDKVQLERLNSLVWPAVLAEAERRVRGAGGGARRVVVLEAAVMLRAGWHRRCHQLWAAIVPPEEAIKRLQQRNGLTEEEARQRVEAQPSNMEQVALANVVFSPYWSYAHTQAQVDCAWELLQQHLHSRE